MADSTDSFLDRRREELLAGGGVVPLDYDELRREARDCLPPGPYDYAAGGAGAEDTVDANRSAFGAYRIVTRVLRDVSERRLRTDLFGRELAGPLMLAPVGGQTKYHEAGELATARAAGELGVPMTLSGYASRTIEDVADANGDAPRLFQLYWPKEWAVAESLLGRAEAAGYDGIVVTLDSQVPRWRRRNLANTYRRETAASKANFESDPVVRKRVEAGDWSLEEYVYESGELHKDPTLTWDDLDRLREWTDLPIVLKGVLHPEDARRANEWGVDGVVVSNHGGRQIDGEVAALHQLAAVVDVMDDDTVVVLDSGVRDGADVFKALALGADVVQFGRPYVFGLAIAGEEGVRDVVLNCLAELESIMGLAGVPYLDDVGPEALVRRPAGPTRSPG